MTEEFNLSEKMKPMSVETEWKQYAEDDYEPIAWEYKHFYHEEDVKEFIKILKENIDEKNLGVISISLDIEELFQIIDKLAGDKLNGKRI